MIDERVRLHAGTWCLAALCALGGATPVFAQGGNPEEAAVQLDWLALSPAFRLSNVGWDDNVFHVAKEDGPTRDFTATASPALEAWMRLPRARANGRSQLDFIYFRELSEIRSIDTDNAGQIDFLLGRLTPYVGGHWANTRHRWNLEIDAPVRRLDTSWTAGVDVRISKKTSIGVTTRRSGVDYEGDAIYLGSNLAHHLDAQTTGYGARVRYALTPLTTVGVDVGQYENEFANIPERDSRGTRVTSVFEFKPNALVSGRAYIGVVSRRFVDERLPEFRGLSSHVELAYTLLGRTRFDVSARRDLSSSYRAEHRDYVQQGVQLSVTHRLANAWDVRGTVGRFTLDYGLAEGSIAAGDSSLAEGIVYYGSEVGYRIGRTRVGLEVGRQARASDFSGGREYERTRIASSFSYVF